MSRKLSPEDTRATSVLSVRLSPATRDALDREATRRSEAAGGVPVSAAVVARLLLEQALAAAVPSTPTHGHARHEEERHDDAPPACPVCGTALLSVPCGTCGTPTVVCQCPAVLARDGVCEGCATTALPVARPRPKRRSLPQRLQAVLDTGMSRRALARGLGVSDMTVRRWLAGEAQPEDPAAIDKALDTLSA